MDVDVDAQTVPRCPSTVVVGMPTRPGARVSFAPTAETQLYTSILSPNPFSSHRVPLTLDKPFGKPYRTNMEAEQPRTWREQPLAPPDERIHLLWATSRGS